MDELIKQLDKIEAIVKKIMGDMDGFEEMGAELEKHEKHIKQLIKRTDGVDPW